MHQENHSLVWFRESDLRVRDHAPLLEGSRSTSTTCVFILPTSCRSPEAARRRGHHVQFLLECLHCLHKDLSSKGAELLLFSGPAKRILPWLVRELKASKVFAFKRNLRSERGLEYELKKSLGVPLQLFEGETLLPVESVLTQMGTPYGVFTPFSRRVQELLYPPPRLSSPRQITKADLPSSVREQLCEIPALKDLGLTRNKQVLVGGEKAGRARLSAFARKHAPNYDTGRDQLGEEATSRLSCDLKFGTISIAEAWRTMLGVPASPGRDVFLKQLLWREFAICTLWHHPGNTMRAYRSEYEGFPYVTASEAWLAWCDGRTGIPLVDAAARQLLREGFVHNRARMVAASFLTKNLLISYRRGEDHYLKHLTDGDEALNNMGWQWAAGCGVDAAPYFRVFNPVLQGQRFDPQGDYIRRYLPELAHLPNKFIHRPWDAPASVLAQAKVELGIQYPAPIADLKKSRAEFLEVSREWLSLRSENPK